MSRTAKVIIRTVHEAMNKKRLNKKARSRRSPVLIDPTLEEAIELFSKIKSQGNEQ